MSEHRAVQTLKESSRLLQYHISKGTGIQIDGLFNVSYTITGLHIIDNKTYTFSQLREDVVSNLTNYDASTTRLLLDTWLKLMIDSVEKGYTVQVKGVGTVLVEEDAEGVYLKGRISPQLEKPIKADFLIMENTDIYLRVFDREQLRLSLTLSPDLRVPRRVQTDDKREYINV